MLDVKWRKIKNMSCKFYHKCITKKAQNEKEKSKKMRKILQRWVIRVSIGTNTKNA